MALGAFQAGRGQDALARMPFRGQAAANDRSRENCLRNGEIGRLLAEMQSILEAVKFFRDAQHTLCRALPLSRARGEEQGTIVDSM